MVLLKLIVSVAACAVFAAAQPVIFQNGVVNSASYVPAGLPGFGVAQGSIATMFGSGFPAQYAKVSAWPLQKTLAGVSIRITVGSTNVDAYPLELANAGQISFLVPSNTPVGTGKITVTTPAGTSAPVDVVILAANPGVYATNMGGSGSGRFQDPLSSGDADQGFYSVGRSARPDQFVDIWLTGLGPVSWDETNVPPGNTALTTAVEVWVGGRQAEVVYRGRSGCCAGLDQIRFKVPQGVSGCFVPVYVVVGSAVSNFLSMPVAPNGGACSDPTGLTTQQVNTLAQGGTISIGNLSLARLSLNASFAGQTASFVTDTADGAFYRYNAASIASSNLGVGITPFGSCTVYRMEGDVALPDETGGATPLDAGAALTLTGPGGEKTLAKSGTGLYDVTLGRELRVGGLPIQLPGQNFPPAYLTAGQYSIRGTGGSQVGAFNATLNVPQPLSWTNQDQVSTVRRADGVTVTWTGGGANDYVMITGVSSIETPRAWTVVFNCYERASTGRFTVPRSVLLQLPPSPAASSDDDAFGGYMGVSTYTQPVSFTATGLDAGYFTSIVSSGKTVTWQ